MYKISELYDLSHTEAKEYLEKFEYPYEALPGISDLIVELISSIDKSEYRQIKENVYVHKTCKVYDTAYFDGPCLIGANSEVRPGAFIRGSALVGENCVIGNSTELKNVIIFDNCQVPHYNYVGDSILGYKAHMGAGAITSNFKADHKEINIHDGDKTIETGLRKIGAFIGDEVEVGCNSVLNPGTVVGRHSIIYPLSSVRGVVKENSIYKSKTEITERQ